MSIVSVIKIALVGTSARKEEALARLQAAGCLHVEPTDMPSPGMPTGQPVRGKPGAARSQPTRPESRRALAFLLASPMHCHPAGADEPFDALAIERRAIDIEERLHHIDEDTRRVQGRIRTLEPWGHFDLDGQLLNHGLRLWCYEVPHYLLHRIPNHVTAWEMVARDNLVAYVAVLHPTEPQGMPVERTHTGSVPLHDLQQHLQALHTEHDALQVERVLLTRWCNRLAASLVWLEDEAQRQHVAALAWEAEGLFALTAWVPEAAMLQLRELADELGLALSSQPPPPEELPPTLLHNQGLNKAGQALLGIFLVPGYSTWDPSAWVLVAFALFFGMVTADAGYALVMAGLMLLWRLRRRPSRTATPASDPARLHAMAWLLTASTGLWGVVTGTWFGVSAPATSWAGQWVLLDAADFRLMMRVSILIGLGHLVLANLSQARRNTGWQARASLGWAAVLGGGGLLGFAQGLGWAQHWSVAGAAVASAGLLLALAAALIQAQGLGARAGALFNTLMRLPGALGDTLSYLRLFALGYAGASLAAAFNELAAQVVQGVPGFGVLLAMLLLLLGHALNLVLGVAGGFVHCLRLNFIEYLNWAGISEGRPFTPFKLKESPSWTPPSYNS